MCLLCAGLSGEAPWTETSAAGQTRRAARLARVRAANAVLRLYALSVDDWQGSAFILTTPTGSREILNDLPQVWQTAARRLGRPIDPLDPALLARLSR